MEFKPGWTVSCFRNSRVLLMMPLFSLIWLKNTWDPSDLLWMYFCLNFKLSFLVHVFSFFSFPSSPVPPLFSLLFLFGDMGKTCNSVLHRECIDTKLKEETGRWKCYCNVKFYFLLFTFQGSTVFRSWIRGEIYRTNETRDSLPKPNFAWYFCLTASIRLIEGIIYLNLSRDSLKVQQQQRGSEIHPTYTATLPTSLSTPDCPELSLHLVWSTPPWSGAQHL